MKTLTKTFFLFTFTFLLGSYAAFAQANEPGSGNCLNFDGVNDFVNSNTDFSWAVSDSFSIGFWINPGLLTGNKGIMGKGAAGGYGNGNWEWSFRLVNSSLSFVYWDDWGWSGEIYLGTGLTQNKWDHIMVTYDPVNKAKLYKNGVLVSIDVTVVNPLENKNTPVVIGHAYWNWGQNYYFNGQIDEVRIWNYSRSQIEIREDMCQKLSGNEVGLAGYWRMDEGSGNTAFDSSPNNNDGTLY